MKDIERRAAEPALVEQRQKVIIDKQPSARNVHQMRTGRQLRQRTVIEHAARLARQRQKADQHLATGEKRAEPRLIGRAANRAALPPDN